MGRNDKSTLFPANLSVRSCPVRKLICSVRSSPSIYFDAVVVFVMKSSLFFRLAEAILCNNFIDSMNFDTEFLILM